MWKSVQSLLIVTLLQFWMKVRRYMTLLISTLLNNSKIHSVCFQWSVNCKLLGLSAFCCNERSCQRWTFHSPVVFILSAFKKILFKVSDDGDTLTHKPTQFSTLAQGPQSPITWRPLVRWYSQQIHPKRVQNYCFVRRVEA